MTAPLALHTATAIPIGQLVRLDLPTWLLGVPIEVGGDLFVGHLAAGAGCSVGGKLYLLGGYHVTWQGQHGPTVGIGCRF